MLTSLLEIKSPHPSNQFVARFLKVKIKIFENDPEGNALSVEAKFIPTPHQHHTRSTFFSNVTFGPYPFGTPHEQTTAQTSALNETFSEVSIKCVYANCLSLPNKLPEIKQLAHDKKPCVIAFTETWLTSEYRDSELAVPDFSLIRANSSRGRAGGVAIYIRDDFPLPLIYFYFPPQPLAVVENSLWLRLPLRSSDALLIGLLYRSPSSDLQRDYDLLISIRDFIHSYHCSYLLLLGDFNAPDIMWDQGISTGGFLSRLLQLVQEEDWTQHVCEPTRYRTGQRPSLLDLVLTDESHLVDNIHMCEPLGKSDHMVLDFEYICYWTGKLATTKLLRNFSKVNFSGLSAHPSPLGLHLVVV